MSEEGPPKEKRKDYVDPSLQMEAYREALRRAAPRAEPRKDFPSEDDLDQSKDRELREKFMRWMTLILAGQLLFVNGTLLGLALAQLITLDDHTLRIWLAGTLIEVFAIVVVIAKYLFPGRSKKVR